MSTPLAPPPEPRYRERGAPLDSPRSDRACTRCGYGVAVDPPPPACPMCGGRRFAPVRRVS